MLVIGATTALFMGFLGIVNNDIKRVIAYSTLSQLGYMTVALGVSAYSVAIFHLMTHAFFKALLFLAAGSVIIAHAPRAGHAQDGRPAQVHAGDTGSPLIGSLALIGTPFFSGFYSKDAIIEAVDASHRSGAGYAYCCVLLGVFVTALYTFRMIFMTFHGAGAPAITMRRSTFTTSAGDMKGPLVALAIPRCSSGSSPSSRCCSAATSAIRSRCCRPTTWWPSWAGMARAAAVRAARLCVGAGLAGGAGVFTAWVFVLKRPQMGDALRAALQRLYRVLVNKYYFDWFNENVHRAAGARARDGAVAWRGSGLIDGGMVNGSADSVGWLARRHAAAAERISVFVRVLDDHRPGGAAGLVPGPHLRQGQHRHARNSDCSRS